MPYGIQRKPDILAVFVAGLLDGLEDDFDGLDV